MSELEIYHRDVVREGEFTRNEECWILLGRKKNYKWKARRVKYSIGEPASVNFNYDWVMKREESKGDILGFVHTHPMTVGSPSMTDYATMHAWVCCFGRPLLCAINGTDGLRAHWFFDDESPHVEGKIRRFGWVYRGVVPEDPTDELRPEYNWDELTPVRGKYAARCVAKNDDTVETFEELNAIQKENFDGEQLIPSRRNLSG
jgi:hypothetical protein